MQEIRGNLSEHADEAIRNARREFDWRHYVGNHPWTSLGAAAAVGFLLVPRRACCRAGNSEAVTEAVDRVARAVQPSPLAGMVSGVLTAVTATIAREALASATACLTEFLGPRGESSRAGPAEGETVAETGLQSPAGSKTIWM
jgi:hypothetical protein